MTAAGSANTRGFETGSSENKTALAAPPRSNPDLTAGRPEPRPGDGFDHGRGSHAQLPETDRLRRHLMGPDCEIGAGQHMDAGLDGGCEPRPHVLEALEQQPAARRPLTELFDRCLHLEDGRHPAPSPRPQHLQVVVCQKQPVLDGINSCPHCHGRDLPSHGVDRHPGLVLSGGSHRLLQLLLIEVGNRADALPRPVPDQLDPAGTLACRDCGHLADVAGSDISAEPLPETTVDGEDHPCCLYLGALRCRDFVDQMDDGQVTPSLVEDQPDTCFECHRCPAGGSFGTPLGDFNTPLAEMGVPIDQPGQGPETGRDDLVGLPPRLHPPAIPGVKCDRCPTRYTERDSKMHLPRR